MTSFLLIDDHEIVRAGVKAVLKELFKPCDIHEAQDESSALAHLKQQSYNVIIMDVQMPGTDAFSLLEYIVVKHPAARVLIFSMSPENVYARRFLQAGAMGFVSKGTGLEELKKAVELVLKNRKYLSADLAERMATELHDPGITNPFSRLSRKEFEICDMLIKGQSVTEIAQILNIGISTVGTHKSRLFEKLGVNNLPELIRLAQEYKM